MIWHAIWFLLGFLCGMTALGFAVVYFIVPSISRPGRPPRDRP